MPEIKYCLRPGRLRVWVQDPENPRAEGWGFKYFTPKDLCRYYNVKMSECVAYDPRKHTGTDVETLIQLHPDPKDIWKIPTSTKGE